MSVITSPPHGSVTCARHTTGGFFGSVSTAIPPPHGIVRCMIVDFLSYSSWVCLTVSVVTSPPRGSVTHVRCMIGDSGDSLSYSS